MSKYVMAFDAGTTSNRCILFDQAGKIVSMAQKEFTQFFPKPGWVEHDAEEIWQTQLEVARTAMANAGASAADISAIGITNQRRRLLSGRRRAGNPSRMQSSGSAGEPPNMRTPRKKPALRI